MEERATALYFGSATAVPGAEVAGLAVGEFAEQEVGPNPPGEATHGDG